MDFIVFSEDWGGHPSSSQHIFRQLMSRGHRVVWFNSIGMRNPDFSLRDVKRLIVKVFDALFGKKKDENPVVADEVKPVEVIQSLVFPKANNALFRAMNTFVLGRRVRKAIADHGLRSPVLWVNTPSSECVIGEAEFSRVVYYCCDDFGSLPGIDPVYVATLEKRLAQKADMVVITNKGLGEKFPADKVRYIPHGVDFGLFTSQRERPAELPATPVAGYYGSISRWLDLALLVDTAKALPEWNFVFIGNVEMGVDVSELRDLKNVHFLGPKNHAELVAYAGNWDVSLIPFRQCEQIEKCNPLKLREYLAVGKPVVSVTFPAVAEYSHVVHLVDYGDVESFVDGIRHALDSDTPVDTRRGTVMEESWLSRAVDVEKAVS